jgi:hypothetical protein
MDIDKIVDIHIEEFKKWNGAKDAFDSNKNWDIKIVIAYALIYLKHSINDDEVGTECEDHLRKYIHDYYKIQHKKRN